MCRHKKDRLFLSFILYILFYLVKSLTSPVNTVFIKAILLSLQLAPENTMVSFNRALQQGADSLEADVAIRLLITLS